MNQKLLVVLLIVSILVPLTFASATPSIDPKDMMEFYVKYKDAGKKVVQAFTILKDADSFNDFYYVPGTPHLVVDADGIPEFSLIKYQDVDPEDRQKLIEGGILQFACTLDMPADVAPKVKAGIVKTLKKRVGSVNAQITLEKSRIEKLEKDKKPVSAQRKKVLQNKEDWVAKASQVKVGGIQLKMVPLKDTEVTIYSPGGDMVSASDGPSIAPSHAGAKMPFSLTLTRLGANVYKGMTEGNTGVPIYVKYTYSGLSAESKIKIEVDWDTTFTHFSTSTKAEIGGSYGPVSANVGANIDTVREDLISNKCIKVVTVANEGYESSELNELMEPLLTRINEELTQATQPPDSVDAAAAPDKDLPDHEKTEASPIEDANGIPTGKQTMPFGVSASVQFSMKSKKVTKSGKEVIDYTMRKMVDRTTCAGGFIGIGGFSDEIKKKCLVVVDRGGWESAYFVLPVVGDKIFEMGVKALELTITPIDPKGKPDNSQTAMYRDGSWTFGGEERTLLVFPLQDLYAKHGAKNMTTKAKYKVEAKFTLEDGSFNTTQEIPMFTGDNPVASPLNLIKAVRINFDGLTFHSDDNDTATLKQVDVKLSSGKRTTALDKPVRLKDGEIYPEKYAEGFYWFVSTQEPLKADISFKYYSPISKNDKEIPKRKIKTHKWKYNDIILNAPMAVERTIADGKKWEKKLAALPKKFAAANKKPKKSAQLKALLKIFEGYYKYFQVKNIKRKTYEKTGVGQPPIGYVINLEDALIRDTGFSKEADDQKAVGNLIYMKLVNDKPINANNFTELLSNKLWENYVADEDDDDSWSFDDEEEEE